MRLSAAARQLKRKHRNKKNGWRKWQRFGTGWQISGDKELWKTIPIKSRPKQLESTRIIQRQAISYSQAQFGFVSEIFPVQFCVHGSPPLPHCNNPNYEYTTDLFLDRQKETYIGGELEHLGAYVYPKWNSLTQALRTGAPQSGSRAIGHYSALYSDESVLETLAKGMTGGSLPVARALAAKFPWRSYRTVIDMGTAQGCVPVQIALSHPHMSGGGFDLPAMRPHFERYVGEHGLSSRLQFFPGDFLNEPLPSADVVVFGRILHNWDLPTKKMLLNKAYEALPAGGALIVYERLIDDERRSNAAALLASLNMLIMTAGGFDFTAKDCIGWMSAAGFREAHTEPLASEQSMVVALK
jgi:hypothetical protein